MKLIVATSIGNSKFRAQEPSEKDAMYLPMVSEPSLPINKTFEIEMDDAILSLSIMKGVEV